METFNKATVKRWMASNIADHTDGVTGEVNATSLAESAARAFDNDAALDDPDHWVWELAATFVR